MSHQPLHSIGHARHRPRKRLHLRIWFAVLASLAVAGLLAGAAWKLAGAEVSREIILTDAAGTTIGGAHLEFREKPASVRVELNDGKILYAKWAGSTGARFPFGFIGWLLLIVGAVGIGAYPVVKRLTRRLDELQTSVDALGEGDWSARVKVKGDDEIALLAQHFNRAAARIEALVGAQKNLLANASHELRSPLARIRMRLELFDRGATAKASDEIARDIAELDQLIEEILLASRLDSRDASQEAFEELDLTALIAEECARSGADFNSAGVVVTLGSPRLLRRLTRNLLDNARRYANAAVVEASLERAHGNIEFAVYDRGPGVPESERERIFDAFYRLKGTDEVSGGAGLGLALVRAIAQQHSGTARCVGRKGGGACFRVTLPG